MDCIAIVKIRFSVFEKNWKDRLNSLLPEFSFLFFKRYWITRLNNTILIFNIIVIDCIDNIIFYITVNTVECHDYIVSANICKNIFISPLKLGIDSRIDFRSKSLPRGARETPAGLIDRGDKKRKREERKEEAALLECFTSICTIMRVSGRRQGTCSSGKSKVSDSKASVTARNNKDDRKVNVFASGGWEGEG